MLNLILALCAMPSLYAAEMPADHRLVLLVRGQIARIQSEFTDPILLGMTIEPSSVRCVAFDGSMIGSCIARASGLRSGFTTSSFLQIGVKEADEDGQEGIRFATQVLLRQGW